MGLIRAMKERIITPYAREEDREIELSLRPRYLREYVGQNKIKENLEIFIAAAKNRREALDHILFYGPPGLGKTTLANVVANEMGVNIRSTSGPVLERPGDLAAILTNLQDEDVLFIDEIHRLNHVVEEILYPAMEDYKLDIIIGHGPNARSIRLDLPHFTLVGATVRAGLLTSPLRDRFGIIGRLDFYSCEELFQIVNRSVRILNISVEPEGTWEIAKRARGTPRIANRLLRRVRDYAQIRADGIITKEVAQKALQMLEVDEFGLDGMDRMILQTLVQKFNGGPVGLDTLAVAVGEEAQTIEDVYEPYLIQKGYLNRTPSGRRATRLTYEYLKLPLPPEGQGRLW